MEGQNADAEMDPNKRAQWPWMKVENRRVGESAGGAAGRSEIRKASLDLILTP